MKIRYKQRPQKISIEIDAIPTKTCAAFMPSVVISQIEGRRPKIISTSMGYITSTEAGLHAEAYMLASFIGDQASKGKSLIGIYHDIRLLADSQGLSALQAHYWPTDTNDSLH